jgi:hypothetical protein
VRYEIGQGNWYTTEFPADELDEIEYKPVNRRRKRELDYIIPVAAVEAYSLFAKPEHAQPLADFLRREGVQFTKDPAAIEGEILFLIDKSTPWEEFVALLNEWKRQYTEGPVDEASGL